MLSRNVVEFNALPDIVKYWAEKKLFRFSSLKVTE